MTSSKISRMPCFVADRAEPLEIALRRHEHARRAGHRLDDHRGDGRGVVERHDALEIIRELGAPGRLPAENALCARSWVWGR